MLLKKQHNRNKKYRSPKYSDPSLDKFSTKNKDMRNVPAVGGGSCKSRDMSRISPIFCTTQFARGHSSVRGMLSYVEKHRTKPPDYSKAGVARAAASFAADQSIRKRNMFRSRLGGKPIPINETTLKAEKEWIVKDSKRIIRQGDIS